MPVDHETVVGYLNRVGITAPTVGDAAGLRVLHRAHLLTVPFENLSIHLGEPISLDEADLTDKIVRRRRGGFCYELNGAFALLLEGLGAQVSRVSARVYETAGLGPPFDHLALIVRPADGSGPWLADVGFGSHSDYPLLLADSDDQDDPAGRFRLAEADAGDIDVLKDGRPQYRIETRERSLADFVPTCWWQQTSPLSHFTRSTICSRLTPGGRVSISGRMLIQTQGGTRTEQQLDTDDALLAAYQDRFGIVLNRVPDDPRLAGVVVPVGRPVLVAEHRLELGGIAVEARLPRLAFLAMFEAVQAGLPAGRVARGGVRAEFLGQDEHRAAVRRCGELEADRVGAPGEADPVRGIPLHDGARQRVDIVPVEVMGQLSALLPLVDHDPGGEPSPHLGGIGDRPPHRVNGPRQVALEPQDRAGARPQQGGFTHRGFLLG
jgi:N-hydroxyarylamine O-acetyltransferase